MAEATHERFVRTVMEHMCASLDLPYEAVMAERDPSEAVYEQCAVECRERAAGEPECPETCLRADAARRKE